MNNSSPMRPYLGVLAGTKDLATGIKLFQAELNDPDGLSPGEPTRVVS